MKYPCVESTIELNVGDHGVRVWIDENKDVISAEYDNSELEGAIAKRAHYSQQRLSVWLASQPRVNAVHVRSLSTGRGRVIYVNWP